MSETTIGNSGPEFGTLHVVRAWFSDPDALQDAVGQLELSGFDRADLSLPDVLSSVERATPDAGAKPADTEEDARQARTLHTSGAAAVGAMAAAGAVIATGGAAVPAVVAAVVGGGVAGGLAHAVSSAANQQEQDDRDAKAATGVLILEVRAMTAQKRATAETILRAAGATHLEAH